MHSLQVISVQIEAWEIIRFNEEHHGKGQELSVRIHSEIWFNSNKNSFTIGCPSYAIEYNKGTSISTGAPLEFGIMIFFFVRIISLTRK